MLTTNLEPQNFPIYQYLSQPAETSLFTKIEKILSKTESDQSLNPTPLSTLSVIIAFLCDKSLLEKSLLHCIYSCINPKEQHQHDLKFLLEYFLKILLRIAPESTAIKNDTDEILLLNRRHIKLYLLTMHHEGLWGQVQILMNKYDALTAELANSFFEPASAQATLLAGSIWFNSESKDHIKIASILLHESSLLIDTFNELQEMFSYAEDYLQHPRP